MANTIAFSAASNGTGGTGLSLTWSHTCSGTNRLLIVAFRMGVGQGNQVTGITYGGVAMTFLAYANGSEGVGIYYLVNPALGANNVVLSTTGAGVFVQGVSASYTGVKQSAPINVYSATTDSNTSISPSVTTTKGNCWTILAARATTSNIVAGANTTLRCGSDGAFQFADSNGARGVAGSYSMTETCSPSALWSIVMAGITPLSDGGAFLFNLV